MNEIVEKPWGYYQVIDEKSSCIVKELILHPKQRLSLQSHKHRNEHWFILQGEGSMTIEDTNFNLITYDSIDIPANAKHRIRNILEDIDLIILEIQTGEFLSEDDIIRYDDDYLRK